MELRHLRYFVAVAEALNFRAAAGSLRVSAPALSRQIKDLEEELGVRLLDRDTQRVRLTTAGVVFLTEARAVLARARRAAQLALEAAQGQRGRLTIGTIGRRLADFMPECLTTFRAKFPEIRVELTEMDYAEQLAALKTGALDIGFMPAQIAPPSGPQFRREIILSTPIAALVGRTHRLARSPNVALKDLTQERLLFLRDTKSSMSAEYARSLFSARQIPTPEIIEVKGFQTLITMVAALEGVSLQGFSKSLSKGPGVVLLPLRDKRAKNPDLELQFCAICKNSDPQRPSAADHFISILRQAIANAKV